MHSSYTYDEKSLIRDGKRFFPIMGEIHYSRYPQQYWKEALLKMKAGGVDIVSSYVIWIHHEEIENEWQWTGERNLRAFVETVRDTGLTMFLRVGPWVHAEVRNGGFPDWLMQKCSGKLRTNDEAYFSEVEKFFREIYEQVKGLFLKDGGPIIGIQVENEFGHCGGLTGPEGEAHMKRLQKMLKNIGFEVPYWTATGWGGAVTAGLLPVMGGYCDAPWDQRTTEIEPSGNFVFTYERNDHAIGSDFGLGEGITFDMNEYPYLTAELGGGLQVTYKRRPVATWKDIAAMSIAKMGSGCNLLGYYMYHGGTNPDGKLSSLQETTATGSFCELPEKSYDFRAPLGEYGYPNESYFALKSIADFVHKNGEELCEMETYIPPENPVTPANFTDLRWSIRFNRKTGNGFVFVNNYQRRNEMYDHFEVCIPLASRLSKELGCSFREKDLVLNVPNGSFGIFNFHGDPVVEFGCQSIVYDDDFGREEYGRTMPDLKFDCKSIEYIEEKDGKSIHHIESVERPRITSRHPIPAGFNPEGLYTASLPEPPQVKITDRKVENGNLVAVLHVEPWKEDHFGTMHDILLNINYTGNSARLYEKGKLIADNIFTGEDYPWKIGLRRFGKEMHDFTLEIEPLEKDADIYLENRPSFKTPLGEENSLCLLKDVVCTPVYHVAYEEETGLPASSS